MFIIFIFIGCPVSIGHKYEKNKKQQILITIEIEYQFPATDKWQDALCWWNIQQEIEKSQVKIRADRFTRYSYDSEKNKIRTSKIHP